MYRVLARTWRPRTFDELIGQGHVARTLGNAITSGRLAHAYLFAGLRGTGKTTVARILARCLNCERGPTLEPCNECAACTEIADSRAIDVLEIDAASRTKVEQTRELLELVSYAPARDRYKVLIIDEAHMLSKHSFNALLKTLEEPPPNILFVLATTEIQKVLPTILSRCQVFEFRRVPAAELVPHLRRIAEAESITISDAALERIARAGEGSVRDSLSLLERVVAFCGAAVSDEDVLRVVGAVGTRVLVELLCGLARRDAGAMLAVLEALVDEGHDLVHFQGELVGALRDLLLLDALPGRDDLLTRPAEEALALRQAAAGLGREDLTRAFQLLADLEEPLKTSAWPQFLFEAALIRLADLGSVRPIEELLAGLGESPGGGGATATATATPSAAHHAAERPAQKKSPGPTQAADGEEPAARLVQAVQRSRPMLGAVLQQCGVSIEEHGVVVRVPAGLEALGRQLDESEGRELVRREARRLVGRELDVRVELDATAAASPPRAAGRPVPPPAVEPRGDLPRPQRAAGRPDPSTGPAPRAARAVAPHLLEQARQEPGVRHLLDTFGARVLEIAALGPPLVDGGEEPAEPRPPEPEE